MGKRVYLHFDTNHRVDGVYTSEENLREAMEPEVVYGCEVMDLDAPLLDEHRFLNDAVYRAEYQEAIEDGSRRRIRYP